MIRVNVNTKKHKNVNSNDIFGGAYFVSQERTEDIMIIEKINGGYAMVDMEYFKVVGNSDMIVVNSDSKESFAQWLDARGYRPFNVKLVEDE